MLRRTFHAAVSCVLLLSGCPDNPSDQPDAAMSDAPSEDARIVSFDSGSDARFDSGSEGGVDARAPGPDANLLNECLVANGGCSENAMCTDRPVGRDCACNSGFVGDGVTCMPRSFGPTAFDAFIKASNTGANDVFGDAFTLSVSGDGNTLAVGAPSESSSGTGVDSTPDEASDRSGAVYIYERSADVWMFRHFIKATNTGANDDFGSGVALSADGNTLAVGADGEATSASGVGAAQDDAAPNSGAVYIFVRSGPSWTFQSFIKAQNAGAQDFFGSPLALSSDGNTLAVGAEFEDSSGAGVGSVPNEALFNSGAAYIYVRTGTTWAFQAFIKATNPGMGDQFGVSIALSADGNTLAVGADNEDSSGSGVGSAPDETGINTGAVYVYARTGSTWAFRTFVKASNADTNDLFGASVALSADGTTLAVGTESEDSSGTGVGSTPNEGTRDSGAVYVYVRSGTTWAFQSFIKASNTGTFDLFGAALALSADGSTLAVGARREDGSATGIGGVDDNAMTDSGSVYVYTRSGALWSFRSYVKASNSGANDWFGDSVALNADGAILAVGAHAEDSSGTGVGSTPNEGASRSGAVYTYR